MQVVTGSRSVTFMASNNLLVPTLTLVFRDKSAASQRDQLGGTKWLSVFRPLVAPTLTLAFAKKAPEGADLALRARHGIPTDPW